MCNCNFPNGNRGLLYFIGTLTVLATITAAFGPIWCLIAGLLVMVSHFIPCCKEVKREDYVCLSVSSIVMALIQIILAVLISQTETIKNQVMCKEESEYELENSAWCDKNTYIIILSLGIALWTFAGVLTSTIRSGDEESGSAVAPDASAAVPNRAQVDSVAPEISRAEDKSPRLEV